MKTQATPNVKFVMCGTAGLGALVAAALFLVFAFAVIFAGMWILAAYTGFVGAIGHAGARKALDTRMQLA